MTAGVDKTKWLSLGVALFLQLVALVWFIAGQSSSIEKNAMKIAHNKEIALRLERDVKGRLDRINYKLDRLIDEKSKQIR